MLGPAARSWACLSRHAHGDVVAGLELTAPTVAAGDGRTPMPVTQGWKDVVRHTINHRTNVREGQLSRDPALGPGSDDDPPTRSLATFACPT